MCIRDSYNITTGKIKRWFYPDSKKNALASNMLYARDGSIYASVIGYGVNRLTNGKFTKIENTNAATLMPRIAPNRNFIFYFGNRLMMFTEANPERRYYLSLIHI